MLLAAWLADGAASRPALRSLSPRCAVVASEGRGRSGAFERRQQLDEEALRLGPSYSSLDEFVRDQLPESQQRHARRRKKEWDPSKRTPHKRDERRASKRQERRAAAASAPQDLLRVAQDSLSAATQGLASADFVGVVIARPPSGPKQAGAFKCWIEGRDGTLDAATLSEASTVLRDALWSAIPGRPALTINAAGAARPLFTAADLERFVGARVQLDFREPLNGRRRLLGELLRTEQDAETGEVSAVVQDETAAAPLLAPLSRLRLGEHTSLRPDDAVGTVGATGAAGAAGGGGGGGLSGVGRQRRARAREGFHGQAAFKQREAALATTAAEAAREAVDEAMRSAPVIAFVGSGCDDSERALALLSDAGCAATDARLRVIRVDDGLAELCVSEEEEEDDDDDDGGGDSGGGGGSGDAAAASAASAVAAVGGDAAGRRAIRHALRYELKLRTGRAPIPSVLMAGVSGPRATASAGSFDGWAGGLEDLEALVAAGPGRLAARLMEAAWTFERR